MKATLPLTTLLAAAAAAAPAAAPATSRTSAPAGCLTVGAGGTYGTIQAAVSALSTTATAAQCIFVAAGTYAEQVTVPARAAPLTLYGATADTHSYAANRVTITGRLAAAAGLSDDATATLRVQAAGFRAYNLNIVNAYGAGSQAVALSAYASSGYYACQFRGYQDTVLAEKGSQLYAGCYIEGATDFIFGQYATAWFNEVEIGVVAKSSGVITANGRTSSSGTSYYVFNSCRIAAAPGNTVGSGAYYLGRPWSQYARVVFQYSTMTNVINSAGWKEWSSSKPNTANVLFGEYGNAGAGASTSARASFSKILSSPVSIGTILGSGYAKAAYYDATYM